MTITGTGLAAASAVQFVEGYGESESVENAESFRVESAEKIVAVAPPGAGTACVTVTTPLGTSLMERGCEFTYTALKPTITALEPNRGTTAGGTTLKITGTNFTGVSGVSFGGRPHRATRLNPKARSAPSPRLGRSAR